MKIAIITDTHYGARGDNKHFATFQNEFFYETFLPYLKENNIKHVLHLGDLMDRRKYVNYVTLKNVRDNFIQPLLDENIQLDVIVGNHDTYYKNTNSVNSLKELFQDLPPLSFRMYWDKPVELEFDNCKIMMCPWICDENYDTSIKAINDTDARVLMGHFEIQGFEMYRGTISDSGENPNLFSKFDLVCSGHFHHKSTHKNIAYLGSPYQINWSDYGDKRGFHIFDTETRELEFIPGTKDLFIKIEYSDENMTIEDITHLDTSDLTGTYIKVIIHNKTNPYLFDLFIDKLQQSGAIDIKVIDDHINLSGIDEENLIDEAQDTMTILKNYVETIEFRGDKTRVEKFLRELYQEAINL